MLLEASIEDILRKLVDLVPANTTSARFIYCLNSKSDPVNPIWDYAADVQKLASGFSYVLQGHGIGKSEKLVSSIEELAKVISLDNQRFNQGKSLHVLLP